MCVLGDGKMPVERLRGCVARPCRQRDPGIDSIARRPSVHGDRKPLDHGLVVRYSEAIRRALARQERRPSPARARRHATLAQLVLLSSSSSLR